MSKSMKAALMSALIFPGAGHFYLKDYIPGAVLAGVAVPSLYYLVTKAVERVLEITEKIQNGEVQMDIEKITELVSNQSTNSDPEIQVVATSVLLISWFIGIVHSFRVGRVLDENNEADVNN